MASMFWLPDGIAEGENVTIADLTLTARGPAEINLPGLSAEVQAWTFQEEEDDVVFTLYYDTDLGLLLAFRLEDQHEDREDLLIELTFTGSNLAFQSYPGNSDSQLTITSQDVSSSQISEHLAAQTKLGGFTTRNELAQTLFYDEGEDNEEDRVGTLGFLPNSCACYLELELEAPYSKFGWNGYLPEYGGLPVLERMAAFDRNLVMPQEEGNTIQLDIFGAAGLGATARTEPWGYYQEEIYVCGEAGETGHYTITFLVDSNVEAYLESSESLTLQVGEVTKGLLKELPTRIRSLVRLLPKGVNHGRIGVMALAQISDSPTFDQMIAEDQHWVIEAPSWRPQAGMWFNWSDSSSDSFQLTLDVELEAGRHYDLRFNLITAVNLHAYGFGYWMEGAVEGEVKLEAIHINGPATDPPVVRVGGGFDPERDCPKRPTALQIDPINEQVVGEPFDVTVNLVDDEGNPAAVRCSCILDPVELHVESGVGNLVCEASGSTPALSLIAGEISLVFENVIYDQAEEAVVIKAVGTGQYSELEPGLSNEFHVKEQEDDDGNGNGENGGELSRRDYLYLNPPTSEQLGDRDFTVHVEQSGNGLLVSVSPSSWPSDEDPYERVVYEANWGTHIEYREGYRYIVYIQLQRWSPESGAWNYCQGSAYYGDINNYPWGFAYGWVDMYSPKYLWHNLNYNHGRYGPGYRRVRLFIWEKRAWEDGGSHVIDGGRGYSDVFWWEFDDDNNHLHFE